MILVMLGTNPYPFTRLIDKVVEWTEKTGEHVIVQSGHTPLHSEKIEYYPFMEHEIILRYISEADVVITQGGFGSLQDCIKLGAKTIAVPRLMEEGESQDDQREIVDALAEEGLVLPLYDVSELDDAIIKVRDMIIQEKQLNTALPDHVAAKITEFLGK